MNSFNQFYDDLRTIDYGLLCVDLYILTDLPIIPNPAFKSQVKRQIEWISGFEASSEEDSLAIMTFLNEVMPAGGVQCPPLQPPISASSEEEVPTMIEDWDDASWESYPGRDFLYDGYVTTAFDNKWIAEQPGLTKIAGARADLMALPKDQVQTHLNLVFDLAGRLTGSSDIFWHRIGKERRFEYEPLGWSVKHFEAFHRDISRDFITTNYPPFDRKDKLYFGRTFLRRYDLLVRKKVELIAYFILEVCAVTGVTMSTSIIQRYENLIGGTSQPTKNTSIPLVNPKLLSDEDKRRQVSVKLAPLSELNPQKVSIMDRSNFDQLIEYTNHLVLTDSLPLTISPFSQVQISNEHIRYTFYRLHKEIFGTKTIKPVFIEFIHAVFTQFKGTTTKTTKAKFSTAPRSYDQDFAGYIGDES